MVAVDQPQPLGTIVTTTDRHLEVGRTLADPVPQTLGLVDQFGLWGNLGVSLLGFTGAISVLQPGGPGTPELSMLAALVAIVVGTVLGTLAVAAAGLPGTITGAPAMVLLRGLFGARLSYLPTVLNIAQLLGWATFEIVTISTAAHRVVPGLPRWSAVILAGTITIALTLRPLGAVRILRRYIGVAMVVVLVYLFVQILRHPLPPLGRGTWSGFWPATDITVAVAVSWVPLAADYSRHARSRRTAFVGALAGFGIGQIACYALGLFVLLTVARNPDDIYGAFIAVPVGSVAFAVLAIRELDQSFANVYSTAVSLQNLRRRGDRRVLAGVIGVVSTAAALVVHIGSDYTNFLTLLGSVFVPLFGVLVVDFFVGARGRRWDMGAHARARWAMVAPWMLGFVAYQLINPGTVSWWVSIWSSVRGWLGWQPASWMSASVCSFVVAGVLAAAAGAIERRLTAGPGGRGIRAGFGSSRREGGPRRDRRR